LRRVLNDLRPFVLIYEDETTRWWRAEIVTWVAICISLIRDFTSASLNGGIPELATSGKLLAARY
jgi:hypothetical protein